MDEFTKLLITWIIEYKLDTNGYDINDVEPLYQEFLDNNKEQLNKIKNLGESSSRLSAVIRS